MFYIYMFAVLFPITVAVVGFGIWKRGAFDKGKLLIVTKVVSAVFFVAAILFFIFRRSALDTVIGLSGGALDNRFLNLVCALLYWFLLASCVILFMLPFFPNVKASKFFVKFFVLPVSALCVIFFYWLAKADGGADAYEGFNTKVFFLAVTVAFCLGVSVVYTVKYWKYKPAREDIADIVLASVGILAAAMPVFMLRTLFGMGERKLVADFAEAHRVLLYLGILVPIFVILALRKKEAETRKYVCLYFALAAMIVFTESGYPLENIIRETAAALHDPLLQMPRLPLHLCNTAMFLLPMTMMFRMKKLFYFSLFIGVMGAFLALIMPDYPDVGNIFDRPYIQFLQNHYTAFCLPVICVSVGVFERPKLKHFVYSMVAFSVYFLSMTFLNAWLDRDYFYTNGDFLTDKLGAWAESTQNITWSLGSLQFYPLYLLLFFLIYVLLGIGVWFVFEVGFQTADNLGTVFSLKERQEKEIKLLKKQMNGRSIHEPLDLEGVDMINIKNFSKKYGNSEEPAVKSVNLTINAGEIFGFLGPNGAGKSTIIKSLVGIQPITKGTIEVCGFDIERQSVEAKKNIGFVPDHYALYERLTGREYVNYVADMYRVPVEERDKILEKLLDMFEIRYAFDSQIATYSHGMKQKTAIMAALVHNPRVWILDEPLTGLDPNSIFQVKESMKEHAKAGNIVFFSSHLIDVVESLCDRIAIIRKGKIVAQTTLAELKDAGESLESYYIRNVGEKGGERK